MFSLHMNYAELIVIALVLALDATVYSFSYGLILRVRRAVSSLWLALTVGAFQMAMPLLGFWGGQELRSYVDTWAPWIVLAVFLLLGLGIIRHAWMEQEEDAVSAAPLALGAMLLVGIATAIDALAVGACMALGDLVGCQLCPGQVLLASAIIGIITFICSLAAFHLARLLHRLPTRWLETLAGLLLIALGVKQLF